MISRIGNNGYRIDAVFDVGGQDSSKNQEMSITSGGPGSTGHNCCGFTTRINLNDGTLQLESEDWSQGETTGATYCKGASCTTGALKSISGGKPLYNTQGVQLSWIVTRQGQHATYQAIAKGPAGTVVSKQFRDPPSHKGLTGPPIIPFQTISGKLAGDPDRVRVDSCKTIWVMAVVAVAPRDVAGLFT
jgi:hypothetical protein